MKEIMDCLGPQDPCHDVTLMKPTQWGATEIGINFFGFNVTVAPGPMMIVQPTVDLGKRYSNQRLTPTINDTKILKELVSDNKSKDESNTKLYKDFEGGVVLITGANSSVGLCSMPSRYLHLDECDRYPLDVDGEGDPSELAIWRNDKDRHKSNSATRMPDWSFRCTL